MQRLKLERVIFIPAAFPPHKATRELASPRDRMQMVSLAIRTEPRFLVSPIEMRRKGPSFTIDTVRLISRRFPACMLFFIIGADTVREIPTWHRYRDIFRLVRFAVIARPGYRLTGLAGYRRSFVLLRTTGVAVSSRDLRKQLGRGERNPIGLPRSVAQYISRRRLYRALPQKRIRSRGIL